MRRAFGALGARSGFALGLSAGLILATAGFLLRGTLETHPGAATAPATVAAPAAGSAGAGSMQAATAALAARLAAAGGPDDQWELLAQSYEFLGRGDDAALARKHQVSSERGLADAVAATIALMPGAPAAGATAAGTSRAAGNADALRASAEAHRRKREFREACADYAALAKLDAMDADAWADYADAQAAQTGHLAGEPARSIDRALAIDARHPKALWLKASLEHEQHRYREAAATWRRLLAVVPPDSSDARIVRVNIAEAERLSAG